MNYIESVFFKKERQINSPKNEAYTKIQYLLQYSKNYFNIFIFLLKANSLNSTILGV